MKVCLIVEGAYPYIEGGMSNWVHQLMLAMPDVEFIIQSIAADRAQKKEIKYRIPDNCTEIQEVYLMDDDYIGKQKQNKLTMTDEEYTAFENLLFGEKPDWDIIIHFFAEKEVSLNALLQGKDFLSLVLDYYERRFSGVSFTDFLWTLRSMYLPLFTCLKSRIVEADLYHSASAGYAGIWGSMEKAVFHKPFLMSEHGIYTREREEEIIKADWVSGIYKELWIGQFRKIGDCCYHYADRVTSLYEEARQFQIELGCSPEKTIVIPNGVDAERFADCAPKDADDPYINVGALLRVTPIKDVKTMISAFAIAKDVNPKLKLWIMGNMTESEEYAQECVSLASELHIPDVEFTGVVNPKDYIGKMDIMVLSSLSEGQPLSILEAFTAEKPFIATNVGNCRGLLEGEFDDWGPAGRIVPVMNVSKMAQAMLELAGDAEKRRKMGETGKKRVRKFYRESDCYEKYHDLYLELRSEDEGWRKWQELDLN